LSTFSFMALSHVKIGCRAYAAAIALLLMAFAPLRAENELSLEQAIELALSHSYTVKGSSHDSAAAAFDLKAARAQRFPTFSLNVTSFYTDEVPSINLPLTTIGFGARQNYQADMKLSAPLFTGGRISNQIRMQNEIARAGSEALLAERLMVAYSTRKAYLELLAAAAIFNSAKASLERTKIIQQDVIDLFRNGMADSLDILDADLALKKAALAQQDKQTSYGNALLALARQTGLPANAIDPADTLPEAQPVASFEETGSERPEIKALENRARAARYALRLNNANFFPNLSGYGTYSYGKPNKDIFNDTWNDFWTVGAGLTWEFNLGGRTVYNSSSARENARSTEMASDDLRESLGLQARISFENLKLAFSRQRTSREELDVAGRKYRLGREKQRAGRLSINRLLELEADLTAAEEQYRASLATYHVAQTEYWYSIGSSKLYGGF